MHGAESTDHLLFKPLNERETRVEDKQKDKETNSINGRKRTGVSSKPNKLRKTLSGIAARKLPNKKFKFPQNELGIIHRKIF